MCASQTARAFAKPEKVFRGIRIDHKCGHCTIIHNLIDMTLYVTLVTTITKRAWNKILSNDVKKLKKQIPRHPWGMNTERAKLIIAD